MSDESEYEVEEFDIYKRKYQLLLERCEILQQVKCLKILQKAAHTQSDTDVLLYIQQK